MQAVVPTWRIRETTRNCSINRMATVHLKQWVFAKFFIDLSSNLNFSCSLFSRTILIKVTSRSAIHDRTWLYPHQASTEALTRIEEPKALRAIITAATRWVLKWLSGLIKVDLVKSNRYLFSLRRMWCHEYQTISIHHQTIIAKVSPNWNNPVMLHAYRLALGRLRPELPLSALCLDLPLQNANFANLFFYIKLLKKKKLNQSSDKS